MGEFKRITFDPNIMGGRACIRGMRLTVSLVLNLVANGQSTQQILDDYPLYAAWLADESIHPVPSLAA